MRVRCPSIPISVVGTFGTVWPLVNLTDRSDIVWTIRKLNRDGNLWKYSGTKPKTRS